MISLSEWTALAQLEREEMTRDYAEWRDRTKHKNVLFVVAKHVDPDKHRADTTILTCVQHGDLLERWWPGSTVMWDHHPTCRYWPRYEFRIVRNAEAERMETSLEIRPPTRPRQAGAIARLSSSHQGSYKRIPTAPEAIEAARCAGPYLLVAYELQPPSWRPARVAIELRGGMMVTLPRYAVYNAEDTRWTLLT